jgi:hypothetical protein
LCGTTRRSLAFSAIVSGRQPITKCGLLMHSSLAITTQGKPLELTAVKFWTRKKFKGANALAYSIAITFAYHNFVRVHQTLKTTPAVAAGVTERRWKIEDLEQLSAVPMFAE